MRRNAPVAAGRRHLRTILGLALVIWAACLARPDGCEASSGMALTPAPSSGIHLVGQPTIGRPIRMPGVLDHVDPAGHMIGLSRLPWSGYFWRNALRNCRVAAGVDLRGLASGMPVIVTLSRVGNAGYDVSGIRLAE